MTFNVALNTATSPTNNIEAKDDKENTGTKNNQPTDVVGIGQHLKESSDNTHEFEFEGGEYYLQYDEDSDQFKAYDASTGALIDDDVDFIANVPEDGEDRHHSFEISNFPGSGGQTLQLEESRDSFDKSGVIISWGSTNPRVKTTLGSDGFPIYSTSTPVDTHGLNGTPENHAEAK